MFLKFVIPYAHANQRVNCEAAILKARDRHFPYACVLVTTRLYSAENLR